MTSAAYPLVSVIIPTYNAQAYIAQAVDSALGQTYPNIEIVIVDDGSTDATDALIAARYADDSRVRYFRRANGGPSAARNAAIAQAWGEYINPLDADDYLLPTKIEKSVALLQRHPEAVAVYGHGVPVLPDGVTEIPQARPPLPSGDVFCEWLIGMMSGGTYSVMGSFMLRRQAVLDAGGFDESFRAAEDWDLWLRLAAEHPFVALDEALVYYRRLPNGAHTNRLNLVMGRLWAVQKARGLPARQRCLTDSEYDRLEAGRWQTVAICYWEMGQRAEARGALREAMRVYPDGAHAQRVYTLFTYFLPHTSVEAVGRLSDWLKGRR